MAIVRLTCRVNTAQGVDRAVQKQLIMSASASRPSSHSFATFPKLVVFGICSRTERRLCTLRKRFGLFELSCLSSDVVYRVHWFSGVWVERAVPLFLAGLKGVEYIAFAWRGSCPYGRFVGDKRMKLVAPSLVSTVRGQFYVTVDGAAVHAALNPFSIASSTAEISTDRGTCYFVCEDMGLYGMAASSQHVILVTIMVPLHDLHQRCIIGGEIE
ncbi:hypothetical protein R1flu_010254 [Riccia fluitans]|uniref:Uncharacterized protein n=1 Tax=Riccia fluitans TaxID=41844 RepID=A0ABD1Z7H9_9MARC